MQKDIINEGKLYITSEDLTAVKSYYSKLINTSFDIDLNYQFIYKELFLHSCYVGNKDIIKWLTNLYFTFDDVTKIALRQLFPYAKYILINKQHKHVIDWYDKEFLPTVRISNKN